MNALARLDVPLDEFKVGTHVKVAGWPSKRSSDRLFLTNLLSSNGRELVTWRYAQPRWAKTAAGYGPTATRFEGGTPTSNTSLFRVWSVQLGVAGAAFDQSVSALASGAGPPLTMKAKKLVEATKTASTTLDGCVKKGMPSIMLTPMPIEFVDKGEVINVRVEFNDTVRTIHMRAAASGGARKRAHRSATQPVGGTAKPSSSRPTRVDWPWFNFGIPQSAAVHLVERFTPSADGSRLDYAITSTDPEMLARPFEQKSAWVWHPSEKLMAFNCVSDYQK